jgi:tetraacyldisaccharide 4'-kinase
MVARRLQRQWYRLTPWQLLLFPVSLVFASVAWLRRLAYRRGLVKSFAVPVPVIVVGNINVGGTGKTPLVLWFARFLRERGFHPGIISRGYGGTAHGPTPVTPTSDPATCGDEPLLLATRSGCPVWVGRKRVAVARALLAAHPECDVLISDDGLQHYQLRRDVEVVVVDAARGFGNGLLLPAGPLREGVKRLAGVDAVVITSAGHNKALPIPPGVPRYPMRLVGETIHGLGDPSRAASVGSLRGLRLHAVAGIGNPERFFAHLRSFGLEPVTHPFPDHHVYRAEDLEFADADAIVMTEKDAVKCRNLNLRHAWVLSVTAELDSGLGTRILEKIGNPHGSETA